MVLQCFLKPAQRTISVASKAPEMMNFGGSQNAIKTNEKLQKPPHLDPQHDEIINIPLVLYGFLNSLQRTIWIASEAPQKVEYRCARNVIKRKEKLLKP